VAAHVNLILSNRCSGFDFIIFQLGFRATVPKRNSCLFREKISRADSCEIIRKGGFGGGLFHNKSAHRKALKTVRKVDAGEIRRKWICCQLDDGRKNRRCDKSQLEKLQRDKLASKKSYSFDTSLESESASIGFSFVHFTFAHCLSLTALNSFIFFDNLNVC
jgi:hypothetical protein